MNLPKVEIENLLPIARKMFLQWDDFMYSRVCFNMPDSEIHAASHCERVLLYALIIGEKNFGEDYEPLEILAQSAIFHDTRRQDEYFDTGHGARAAVYYKRFCHDNDDIVFHAESVFLMRYHDLDDNLGKEAIRKRFDKDADRVLKLYAIFKDADALDRWRLGSKGIDPEYLRTEASKNLVGYSRRIVKETMSESLLQKIDETVNELMSRH